MMGMVLQRLAHWPGGGARYGRGLLIVLALVAAMAGLVSCMVLRSRTEKEEAPGKTVQLKPPERLEELGVPTYPGAELAPGESRVAAPSLDEEGTVYLFRFTSHDDVEKILEFYRKALKEGEIRGSAARFVTGRTPDGWEVTVVPDRRDYVLRRPDGTEKRVTLTDYILGVRVHKLP